MHVFSKLSLIGIRNRVTATKTDRDPLPPYNACDNTACQHRNGLQPVEGRYNCTGRVSPATTTTSTAAASSPTTPVGSTNSLGAPRILRSASAPSRLCHLGECGREHERKREEDGEDKGEYLLESPPCPGTYYVDAAQADFVSHMRCDPDSTHCRRIKRSRTAEREARARALKVEKVAKREFEREYAARKRQMKKERLMKEKEELEMVRRNVERTILTLRNTREDEEGEERGERVEAVQQQQQPVVKQLKREVRRLPVVIKTEAVTNDASASPRSPLKPALRHRRLSDSGPRHPRPACIIWDDPIVIPVESSSKPLWIHRSPASDHKKRDRNTRDAGAAKSSGSNMTDKVCVRYKNGLMITHFSTLLPANHIPSTKFQLAWEKNKLKSVKPGRGPRSAGVPSYKSGWI